MIKCLFLILLSVILNVIAESISSNIVRKKPVLALRCE